MKTLLLASDPSVGPMARAPCGPRLTPPTPNPSHNIVAAVLKHSQQLPGPERSTDSREPRIKSRHGSILSFEMQPHKVMLRDPDQPDRVGMISQNNREIEMLTTSMHSA